MSLGIEKAYLNGVNKIFKILSINKVKFQINPKTLFFLI